VRPRAISMAWSFGPGSRHAARSKSRIALSSSLSIAERVRVVGPEKEDLTDPGLRAETGAGRGQGNRPDHLSEPTPASTRMAIAAPAKRSATSTSSRSTVTERPRSS